MVRGVSMRLEGGEERRNKCSKMLSILFKNALWGRYIHDNALE